MNSSSRSMTPQTAPHSGHGSAQTSGTKMARLVDLSADDDDDEVAVAKFGHLKVGFTPGMDGRSRRVCLAVHTITYLCYKIRVRLVIQSMTYLCLQIR